MTATKITYVDLNVRELFEENTVETVKEIHKKVNYEIERKREELRTLVGESYRDLIDAADTIATMKTSSSAIVDKLKDLRLNLKTFPRHLAVGNNIKPYKERKYTASELEIVAELKLSIEVPRHVQFSLEKGKVIEALHIYLFAQKLNMRSKPYRWSFLESAGHNNTDSIVGMRTNILNYVECVLQDTGSAEQSLAECIVTQQVLSNQSCEDVLRYFLTKQLENCERVLKTEGSEFIRVVAFTIHSLHSIFIDPQLYSSVTKIIRKPKIQCQSLGVNFAPKSLEQFNNEVIEVGEPPRVSRLASIIIENYITGLKSLLERNYDENVYLKDEATLESMENYRKSTLEATRGNCEDLMRIVLGTTKSLWTEVFLGVFHAKCKSVVTQRLEGIISFIQLDAFPRLERLDGEFDLINFVWTPTALENTSRLDDELKLKCVSPYVAEMNQESESRLLALLSDSRCLDDKLVKDFISTSIESSLEKLLQDLKASSPGLFLGRWAATIGEFCPTLWKLLKQQESTKLRQVLASVSEACFASWTTSILEIFQNDLQATRVDTDGGKLAKSIPVAEEYVSEAEGSLKPSIRIPLQVSHGLQSLLFGICFELGKIGPQSIPKNVRDEFRFTVGQKLAEFYAGIDLKELTPQAALQLIFDLKYVQWFHPKLSTVTEPILAKFEALIDPFDMDIVGPKLKVNLKRCLFENHLTLGLLFSEESHGFIAQNFKTKGNLNFPLSNPPRNVPLPLLPI